MTEEKLAGFANGIKGKYFEVLVADRLNGGESLGDLALETGQFARIADTPTQTGWDLQIVNENDGSVVELLQLKATDSMAYVNAALTRYPDIRVATTSEVDGVAENILLTDISNSKLEEVVRQYVDELTEDTLTDTLHQGAEWAFDAVPLIPAILVAIIEGKSVMVGRTNIDEALQRGARRMSKAAAFSTLGATLTALNAGLLSVPVTVAARIGWSRVANQIAMTDFLETKTRQIKVLTAGRRQGS